MFERNLLPGEVKANIDIEGKLSLIVFIAKENKDIILEKLNKALKLFELEHAYLKEGILEFIEVVKETNDLNKWLTNDYKYLNEPTIRLEIFSEYKFKICDGTVVGEYEEDRSCGYANIENVELILEKDIDINKIPSDFLKIFKVVGFILVDYELEFSYTDLDYFDDNILEYDLYQDWLPDDDYEYDSYVDKLLENE